MFIFVNYLFIRRNLQTNDCKKLQLESRFRPGRVLLKLAMWVVFLTISRRQLKSVLNIIVL